MLTDLHTHSYFSPNGHGSLGEMVAAARELGVRYYGVSEHFDCDFLSPAHYAKGGGPFSTTDQNAYFPFARELQAASESPSFTLLVGAEFGFCPDPAVQDYLVGIQEKFSPDFVINSVHIIDGADVYFAPFFEGKSKREAYEIYLRRVLESLDARYSYDIVGHIGYPSRNAPYGGKAMRYADFPALFDEILSKIIEKGKILEVNGSTAGLGTPFLPDLSVLERYFALGGRRVSYGSDAHGPSRICQNRREAAEALRAVGFSRLTVPCRGSLTEIEL